MFGNAAQKAAVTVFSLIWFAAATILAVWLYPIVGAICIGCAFLAYLCCVKVFFKIFGGISGDLAGWMVQVVELVSLLSCIISNGVVVCLQ